MAKEHILEVVEAKIPVKAKSADPKKTLKSKKGLWVSTSFQERVLSSAKPAAINVNLSSFKLLVNASDKKIEGALPEKHIFTASEVCAVLAVLIKKQSKGQEGFLDLDRWNLFYLESCVVGVHWFVGGWLVGSWDRDYRGWDAAYRVISPATDA